MTETDDSKPPDTLPPPKDADPTPRELMAALLATRDIVVDELSRAFVREQLELELLNEAAEERGRRKQREEEIRIRSATSEVAAKDADVEALRSSTKVARWKGVAVAIAIVFAAVSGLIGAAIGSHH